MSKQNFHTMLKRGSLSSIGVLLSRVFTAFAGIIMARAVGPANFGIYASLWALIQITLAFSETGMTTGIKRDGARNPALLPILLGNTLLVKIMTGSIALALATFSYGAFTETDKAQPLIFPLIIIAFLLLFVEPFFAIMQVKGKQKMVAILQTGKSLLLLTGFSVLAMIQANLIAFVWFQALLNCIFLVIIYVFSSSLIGIKCNFSKIGSQFYRSLVFGVSGILFTTYTQIPVLALARFASSEEVGYFAVAYRFIELIFVAAAAASNNAFLPTLFGLYKSNRRDFLAVCDKMQTVFVVLGIFAATSLYVCAEPLILLLQGEEYRPAIEALQIMSWAVMLNMGVLAAGASLTASDRMRSKILFQICVIGVVLIASVFIIKPYGFLGASYTICIMWGTLVILYFPYAGYHRLIMPAGIFRLFLPSMLTIMSALFTVNYFPFSLIKGMVFFFLSTSLVWFLTFLWIKKRPTSLQETIV